MMTSTITPNKSYISMPPTPEPLVFTKLSISVRFTQEDSGTLHGITFFCRIKGVRRHSYDF